MTDESWDTFDFRHSEPVRQQIAWKLLDWYQKICRKETKSREIWRLIEEMKSGLKNVKRPVMNLFKKPVELNLKPFP